MALSSNSSEESERILDVSCGATAVGEDYTTQGAKFSTLAASNDFWGNFRGINGYGCPITVFIVRKINGASGCSINILSNYVTVNGKV